jgi:DNA-binding CsgD family transcriptional regulator
MQGKSTGEIAQMVGISRNQVWVHLTLLYRIHKVHRRDELVEKLRRRRGVEEDAETGPSLISRNQK